MPLHSIRLLHKFIPKEFFEVKEPVWRELAPEELSRLRREPVARCDRPRDPIISQPIEAPEIEIEEPFLPEPEPEPVPVSPRVPL